ncbi:MAG TPA: UMP kinase [Polyangiaceae bacterium]|nr:UMP kinase [Polyangiaceae bacterium]
MSIRMTIQGKPQPVHPDLKIHRVLLKLSGEALGGPDGAGLDSIVMRTVSLELKEIFELGVQLGIVVGGGNIFRGLKGAAKGMDRAQADHMGMLATVINSLALQDALESVGVPTRVLSALEILEVAEPYIRRKAMAHLERGNVVIFAAGTGSPFFSTDTAAALRAVEMHADCVLKATKVDGIYDKDPVQHKDAKRYATLTYDRFLAERIGVMDATAVSLCRENAMPIRVFSMTTEGNFRRVCMGDDVGTTVVD